MPAFGGDGYFKLNKVCQVLVAVGVWSCYILAFRPDVFAVDVEKHVKTRAFHGGR